MKKYFPLTDEAKKDVYHLIVVIVVYVFAMRISGFVLGLISWLPLVGILVKLVKLAIDLYCIGGILDAIFEK